MHRVITCVATQVRFFRNHGSKQFSYSHDNINLVLLSKSVLYKKKISEWLKKYSFEIYAIMIVLLFNQYRACHLFIKAAKHIAHSVTMLKNKSFFSALFAKFHFSFKYYNYSSLNICLHEYNIQSEQIDIFIHILLKYNLII